MVRLLFLKMFRDMKKSAVTYLACMLIIAVGFTGYSVLSIASEQLSHSQDYFFEATNFCEVFAAVEQAPRSVERKLAEIEGIKEVQGRLVETVRVAGLSTDAARLKLISFEKDALNIPLLSTGNWPEAATRQLLIGDGFFEARNLAVGDEIELMINGHKHFFTIAGSGIMPENIYMIENMAEFLPDLRKYDAAFLEYETLSRLFSMEGRVNEFIFMLEDGYVLSDVKERIEEILKPYGCRQVYDRGDQMSVAMLDSELDQLAQITGVVPFLFLLVSAVILYITLHRMIEQQRTQIGAMMAMGIWKKSVGMHYMSYGAFTGFVGGICGGILGSVCAGPMTDYYRTYFSLPQIAQSISLHHLLLGTVVATVFCAVIGWITAKGAANLQPAQALRPAPPQSAKISIWERLPFLVEMLTVPGLMAIRALSRNKRRALLSVGGIACAYMITATLLSMYTLFDVYLFDSLEKMQRQDITVAFNGPVRAADAYRAIQDPAIEKMEGLLEVPITLRGKSGETSCTLQGMEKDSALVQLQDEENHIVQLHEEGIVLSMHMANVLGVGVGDEIEAELNFPKERITRVIVTGIVAQYMGSTAYASHQALREISGYGAVFTSVLLKAPAFVQEGLLERLDDAAMVASAVSREERIGQYRTMMGNMDGIMSSMALMGVLIGFAVIYTSSLINFEELKREIATMRMLGLSDKQCLSVVTVGQWLLTAGGIVVGIPLTMGASRLVSASMASELFIIPDFVSANAIGMAIALTFLAVYLGSLAIYRKLRKISPVELLRERE